MRPGLPGPRRHPGAARRRGPQARLSGPRAMDLRRRPPRRRGRAAAGRRRACATWPRAEPGSAARRSRPRRRLAEAVERLSDDPAARGGRRRSGLAAAARGAGAGVPGAVRRLARAGLPGWAGSARPGRGARARRHRPGHRGRRRRGRTAAAARWSWPPPRTRWSAGTSPAATPRCCRPVTGDQLATATVMLDLLDRLRLGPRHRPRRGRRPRSTSRGAAAARSGTWR